MSALSFEAQRRLFQLAVLVLSLVPIGGGLYGMLNGFVSFAGDNGVTADAYVDLDSHGRYLSGLLLAIGFAFWSTVPNTEAKGERFALLTAIVFVGGLGRLMSVFSHGLPFGIMTFGLIMELVVTPLLWLWHSRIVHLCKNDNYAA
jgi:hypothetical protein